MGGLGAVPPAYEAGEYEAVIEQRPRDARGESGYAGAALQPRLLRGARRPHGGCDRPSAQVAFEGRPGLRDLAKEDTDLDPLRDEPGFQELVA